MGRFYYKGPLVQLMEPSRGPLVSFCLCLWCLLVSFGVLLQCQLSIVQRLKPLVHASLRANCSGSAVLELGF
jgi:hypothetical protein